MSVVEVRILDSGEDAGGLAEPGGPACPASRPPSPTRSLRPPASVCSDAADRSRGAQADVTRCRSTQRIARRRAGSVGTWAAAGAGGLAEVPSEPRSGAPRKPFCVPRTRSARMPPTRAPRPARPHRGPTPRPE